MFVAVVKDNQEQSGSKAVIAANSTHSVGWCYHTQMTDVERRDASGGCRSCKIPNHRDETVVTDAPGPGHESQSPQDDQKWSIEDALPSI